ncbi:EAL domain-containing protein [Breoghania sp.]|uniref:putative bifunctional diguanylate cyclase/phosphodiesterase n=1 Tax=Breoghania sp. TaxID=2065378 RepID=UPI002AAC1227|nr:EAL domain-containing protein [Breoghania sp.]
MSSKQGEVEKDELLRQLNAAQAELTRERRRYDDLKALLSDIVETLGDPVVAFDGDDRLVICNPAFRKTFPVACATLDSDTTFENLLRRAVVAGEIVPTSSGDIDAADSEAQQDNQEAWIGQCLKAHRSYGGVLTQKMGDGRWLRWRERCHRSGNRVGVATDISALKEAQSLILNQTELDPLTGLLNRTVLLERLQIQVDQQKRIGGAGALVLLDVVKFKEINDRLGHAAGDEFLVEVGHRLKAVLRFGDDVFRLGGDEFALILGGVRDRDGLEQVLGRVRALLAEPLRLRSDILRPAAAMGVCLFPEHGADAADLMKFADNALYLARQQGGERLCLFSANLRDGLQRRGDLVEALRTALDQGRVGVAFQPQFAIADGSHTGFEALARWTHEGYEVPPTDFIPVAEEIGLIVQLGQAVLETSLAILRDMLHAGLSPGVVAVNAAAAQLKHPDFADQLTRLLTEYDIPPYMLEIEITENVLLDRSSVQVEQCLHRLKALGVAIALDDFGTGHASLSHLKRVPVDRLKIDRSFVSGIGQRPEDEVIVRTVVSLAHSLGKTVVAEGVESEAHRVFLCELGCDVGQGYLISRPLDGKEVHLYLANAGAPAQGTFV